MLGRQRYHFFNRSTGDGAECDDIGVDFGAADDIDGSGVFRLANDAKRLM
jgi:hypothetical protein